MKGIILAGGAGTRLYPLTTTVNKQLLPVYDKPMVYYPISTLMLAGIRDIMIISTPEHLPSYEKLLGDGSRYGVRFSYSIQEKPNGIAQAFTIAQDFIGGDSVALMLGDNILYGNIGLQSKVKSFQNGALIFGYRVQDPQRYGIVEFDSEQQALSLEEKPAVPKSDYAVIGLYIYDNSVVSKVQAMKPSKRGELEITDLNNVYLADGKLNVVPLGRGVAWFDAGTTQSLLEASEFIATIEMRTALKIGCLEEIALSMRYKKSIDLFTMPKSAYRDYLEKIVEKGVKV